MHEIKLGIYGSTKPAENHQFEDAIISPFSVLTALEQRIKDEFDVPEDDLSFDFEIRTKNEKRDPLRIPARFAFGIRFDLSTADIFSIYIVAYSKETGWRVQCKGRKFD